MINALVNIYVDKKENILIIPRWTDEDGIGRLSERYVMLEENYDNIALGEKILWALCISEKNESEDKNAEGYLIAGNVKNWRAFWKKYECMSVHFEDNGIWKVKKKRKLKDGSYGLEAGDEEKYTRKFQEPLSAEQLGTIVLEMLKIK